MNYTRDDTLDTRFSFCCCYIFVVLTRHLIKNPYVFYFVEMFVSDLYHYERRKWLFVARIKYYPMAKQILIDVHKIKCYSLWSKLALKDLIFFQLCKNEVSENCPQKEAFPEINLLYRFVIAYLALLLDLLWLTYLEISLYLCSCSFKTILLLRKLRAPMILNRYLLLTQT